MCGGGGGGSLKSLEDAFGIDNKYSGAGCMNSELIGIISLLPRSLLHFNVNPNNQREASGCMFNVHVFLLPRCVPLETSISLSLS